MKELFMAMIQLKNVTYTFPAFICPFNHYSRNRSPGVKHNGK